MSGTGPIDTFTCAFCGGTFPALSHDYCPKNPYAAGGFVDRSRENTLAKERDEARADAEALAEALEETSDLLRRRDLGKGRRESVAGWEWAVLQTHVDAALARYRGEKP